MNAIIHSMAGAPEKVRAAFRVLAKQQKHLYLKKIRRRAEIQGQ